ncbi:MAG: aminoacyl-tRNA hydrolase [Actinobacteria bacterium]|nr:aminoacyl-tRNA hydrolase [Actinomycetota bacterium]NBO51206.1 aminoacyl-tRNA hydrolase [Actinomycetota bacterium]NBQ59587.1 aminoacyl-tRNA hydrolase [Actinomycetota bacterium]NBY82392.1 aminoacyl-tRNA hydrolase [Actinomycetota bacterium]NCA25534.1 aminoacyl-tRNA hydrolase [Actinomycetota bacterium]
MANRWLVVGLGNPGPEYEKTRHNIGQLVLNLLSENQKFSSHKSRMEISEVKCSSENLLLAKSLGYMNEYGAPTRALADFYKIPLEQIIVIHDELDLPFNNLRIKLGGGDNGHNGLKSITASLGSSEYFRIRMGIGRPIGGQDPADFVLKQFSKEEKQSLSEFLKRGAAAVESLVLNGLDKAQTNFND